MRTSGSRKRGGVDAWQSSIRAPHRLNLYEHPPDRVLGESVQECGPQADARRVALRLVCDPDVRIVLDKLKTRQV